MASKLVNAAWMGVLIFTALTAAHMFVDHFAAHGPTLAWASGVVTTVWIGLTIGEWDETDDE